MKGREAKRRQILKSLFASKQNEKLEAKCSKKAKKNWSRFVFFVKTSETEAKKFSFILLQRKKQF
jgi:hypothetical protein